ncbi:MAG: fumarate hydratase [Candidatus Rifleibacteriota bacterium]
MSEIQLGKIFSEGIETKVFENKRFVCISSEVLTRLSEMAFHNLAYYLRKEQLESWARIVSEDSSTANEKLVCSNLIKNAVIASEGILPLCQDTGTATVFAWKGEQVLTGSDDKLSLEAGIKNAYQSNPLRFSQLAPISMFSECNTQNNLPAQIDIFHEPGEEYKFLFMAKGAGSSNKTVLIQGSKAVLNETSLKKLLREKLSALGTAACPPYTITLVVGGSSPEQNLFHLKLASAGWLDAWPTAGHVGTHGYRDKHWEKVLLQLANETGLGAQFGGSNLAIDSRVFRLPRHAGSCMLSLGVSCSAHRCITGKITAGGAFLEELEKNPGRFLSSVSVPELKSAAIDLNLPMPEIIARLSKLKAGAFVRLSGPMIIARDMVHARINEYIFHGKPVPDYFFKHPIFYAGPARTPEGCCTGSIGPTTADRMDNYANTFMKNGIGLVTIAKGNRSEQVAKACRKYGGFYLGTIGGAAALLAKEHVINSEIIGFEEFGMEAARKILVKDFPAFIIYDNHGHKLY